MISKKEWDNYTTKKQDKLSEDVWSYRQCQKCLNYIYLGGNNEENAEGMYLDGHPFDCSDETIDKYEIKNNFSFCDNTFCFKCINQIKNDLDGA
jgi:hypothetical protein